jgi:hypothetical protein
VDDVVFAHEDQVSRHGSDSGLRDRDLPESAVAQPRTTFGGVFRHDSPFAMAAA